MILYEYRSSIGQDSHAFDSEPLSDKPLLLGGYLMENERPLKANSDGDVVLHALTNAISGISGVNILGSIADRLCLEEGITDSSAYLDLALASLRDWEICHVSFSVECLRPRLEVYIPKIKAQVAKLLGIHASSVGLTATSGEKLTAVGQGQGIAVFCCLSVRREIKEA